MYTKTGKKKEAHKKKESEASKQQKETPQPSPSQQSFVNPVSQSTGAPSVQEAFDQRRQQQPPIEQVFQPADIAPTQKVTGTYSYQKDDHKYEKANKKKHNKHFKSKRHEPHLQEEASLHFSRPPTQVSEAFTPVQGTVSALGLKAWGQKPSEQAPMQPTSQPVSASPVKGPWGRKPPEQAPMQPTSQPVGASPVKGPWDRKPPEQAPMQPTSQPVSASPVKGPWDRKPPEQAPMQPTSQPVGASPVKGPWGRKPPEQAPMQPTSQPVGASPVKGRGQQQQQKKTADQAKQSKVISQDFFSKSLTEYAPRIPASEKSGHPIRVATNFYPLIISNYNINVYHYDVTIDPDKPKNLLRLVWQKFCSQYFSGRITVFDGVKNAFSKNELISGATFSGSVTVFNHEVKRDKEFNVTIKEAQKIDFSVFKDYRKNMLQDKRRKVLPEAETMVLEIILKNFASEHYIQSYRTFFRPKGERDFSKALSNRLNLRYGFFQSAFLGYRLYLIFDIAHKPFYRASSVLTILNEFRNRNQDLNIEEFNSFIKNAKVKYEIPNHPESARIFRVNSLVKNADQQKFEKEDGSTISVLQYFLKEKNIQLRYPNLPLLWVGPHQKNIYVPLEFCEIVEDQIFRGLMNPFETREMVKSATQNAKERKKLIDKQILEVKFNENPFLKEFGIKISNEMELVDARVLRPPTILTTKPVTVNEGVWRANEFYKAMDLKRWCILNLDRFTSRENVRKLENLIISRGRALKMNTQNPARDPIDGDPSQAFLKRTFSQLKDMDIVFVIISEVKGVYSKVKTICETQEGVLTQCIKSKTVSQDDSKITTTIDNILLKVNAKLGGKNHTLDERSMPKCLKGYTMIIGADVTHSGPGSNIPSVAAVAVCCDSSAFQYSTTIRVQMKEIIKNLEEIMESHLKYFYKTRKEYPEKIFFFRDGVSEGQLDIVFNEELKALKNACRKYNSKITFVVVQKRHHTRFFPTSKADETGRNLNVPVGTCVDTDVVHPRDLDFYLVSHASILGTARPTRYRLLFDENNLTDDELENLSYYLCHMYSRCKRSVSYPSPTYHAHLAAFRARAYLEEFRVTIGDDLNSVQNKLTDKISYRSPMFFV